MRLKHRAWVQITRDTAYKQKLFYPEAETVEVVTDIHTRMVSGTAALAQSTAKDLSLGDLTVVKGLYLEASALDGNGDVVAAEVQVQLNGSTYALVLTPSEINPAKLFLECNISQVYVTNLSSSNQLDIVYCMWGNPT